MNLQKGLTQLRLAETEKYAHVTFFFNGGNETVSVGEDRHLIPSPKVPTYDCQPEMSAPEVTKTIVEEIKTNQQDDKTTIYIEKLKKELKKIEFETEKIGEKEYLTLKEKYNRIIEITE